MSSILKEDFFVFSTSDFEISCSQMLRGNVRCSNSAKFIATIFHSIDVCYKRKDIFCERCINRWCKIGQIFSVDNVKCATCNTSRYPIEDIQPL